MTNGWLLSHSFHLPFVRPRCALLRFNLFLAIPIPSFEALSGTLRSPFGPPR